MYIIPIIRRKNSPSGPRLQYRLPHQSLSSQEIDRSRVHPYSRRTHSATDESIVDYLSAGLRATFHASRLMLLDLSLRLSPARRNGLVARTGLTPRPSRGNRSE